MDTDKRPTGDPVMKAIREDTRLPVHTREAFIAIYIATLRTHEKRKK